MFLVIWLSQTIDQPVEYQNLQCFATRYKINIELRHEKILALFDLQLTVLRKNIGRYMVKIVGHGRWVKNGQKMSDIIYGHSLT